MRWAWQSPRSGASRFIELALKIGGELEPGTSGVTAMNVRRTKAAADFILQDQATAFPARALLKP